MQLTIFGASGRVGQLVVAEALRRGYSVRAFVHRSNPFTESNRLRIIKGDLSDSTAIAEALQGSDAVISTLGSWGTADKNTLTTGMKMIIPAMEAVGLRRIVTLTGSGARLPEEQFSWLEKLNRLSIHLVASKILADSETHLRLLTESELDWTALRSPAMRPRGKAAYILHDHPGWPLVTIPRPAVASAAVDLATSDTYVRQAPTIRRQ